MICIKHGVRRLMLLMVMGVQSRTQAITFAPPLKEQCSRDLDSFAVEHTWGQLFKSKLT